MPLTAKGLVPLTRTAPSYGFYLHAVDDFGAVGDGAADDTAALQSMMNAADAAGGGSVYIPHGTYKITSTLMIGSASAQHYINVLGDGPVNTVISWAGATNTPAIILNSEKLTRMEGVRVNNTVAKGTTEGIRLMGTAGTGTQTNGGILERIIVDGFHIGLRTSNGASSTSSEMTYVNFYVQFCDIGIQTSDFNAISHNFYNLGMALNTLGMDANTGGIHVWGGSASSNDDDFSFVNDSTSSIMGFYSETVVNKFVTYSTAAGSNKLSIINCVVNGVSTPNAHVVISLGGGKVTIQDSNIGGQILFSQGNANASLILKNNTIIDNGNSFTTTANPDLMGPGFRLLINSGGGGYFDSSGNAQCNADFNTIVGQWPSGKGYITTGATGQGIAVMQDNHRGSDVASASTIVARGPVIHVTGTTNITSVSGTDVPAGMVVTLIFDGVLTFTDGSNLKLAGNFTTAADSTITLRYDGSNWLEVCRSVN